MQIEVGSMLAHYEIAAPLGRGGMGEVYRARDTKLGREVAIKILPEEFTNDAERLARFEREARLLASLDHAHIASIHGFEEVDGVRFLVMQLAEGEDLSDRIRRQGSIPVDEAIEIGKQIAEALEVAHDQGIVHRDLKPANVKIDDDGQVKILDFGLAKALEAEESDDDFANSPTMVRAATHDGVILGTAAYMSPEQARGKTVDRRADIWAFGVMLWEMLTGRRLFAGDTVSDTIASVLKEEPDWKSLPADTPPAVHRILRLCLEKHPKNRLHDIADARLILEGAFDVRGQAPVAAERPADPHRWVHRIVWLAIGAILAVGGLIALNPGRVLDGTPDPSAPLTVRFQRLTELPGAELQPTLSPDGSMVVYASTISGNLDLYLLRVGGDRAIPLTTHPANDSQAAFSPDGQWIAFRSERDGGGLFVMGATGESVRRVTSTGYDPAWSPDGTRIAYSTEPVWNPYRRASDAEIWVADVASGETRRVVSEDSVQPSWSPDGRFLAYWTNDGGQRDIRLIDLESGEPAAVTSDLPTDWSPAWSPDGAWLYFSSDRSGSMNLWRIPIDQETGRPAGEPEPVTRSTQALGYTGFSEDGSRAVVMSYGNSYEQTIYRVDPANPTRPAVRLNTMRNPSATVCRLSPDGNWLACRTDGVPEDLILVRHDGVEMRRLTSDAAKDRNPKWNPAGDQLIFTSTRGGEWEWWTIRIDGSDLRRISRFFGGFGTWDPEGKEFLMFVDGSLKRIEVATATVDEVDFDLELGAREAVALESATPVENRVVGVVSDGAGRARSYQLFELDRAAVRPLGIEPFGDVSGSVGGWFPDGRHLLVRTRDGATVVDRVTGRTAAVAPAESNDKLCLSLDGTTLMVEKEIRDSDIWLLELD